MSFELYGVYPPIVTPFVDGEISFEKLSKNVQKWNDTGLAGLVVMGSNGEFPHLTETEQMEVVGRVNQVLADDKKLIVGTGTPATHGTISRTELAADAGAQAVMVIPPYYYRPRMGYDELRSHYIEVADSSPVPVILYNMPSFAGIDLNVGLIVELSNHPNIIGIKDSSGNVTKMSSCVIQTSDDFRVMAGSGSYFLPALLMGCSGGVMALANVAPEECVELYEMAQDGRWEEAAQLQKKLVSVNQALTAKYSIPGLKYALQLRGYFGGKPRRPLLPINEEAREHIENILKNANLI